MVKKANPTYEEKMKWGNGSFKNHASNVVYLALKIIRDDLLSGTDDSPTKAEGKRILRETRDAVIPEVCLALMEPLWYAWKSAGPNRMTGQGYCEFELGELVQTVRRMMEKPEGIIEDAFELQAAKVRKVCEELAAGCGYRLWCDKPEEDSLRDPTVIGGIAGEIDETVTTNGKDTTDLVKNYTSTDRNH